MRGMVPSVLRSLLLPLQFAPLLLAGLFAVLLFLALQVGLVGIPLEVIVLSWFSKYCFALLDAALSSDTDDRALEGRMVDEAKAVLMDRNALTEGEAFSFIQRTAMASRTRMREVAQRVVDGSLAP